MISNACPEVRVVPLTVDGVRDLILDTLSEIALSEHACAGGRTVNYEFAGHPAPSTAPCAVLRYAAPLRVTAQPGQMQK